MTKRLVTLALVLSLIFTCMPAALAAEGDVRETDFFTDQEHVGVDWKWIVSNYEHIEMEPILEDMDSLRELAQREVNVPIIRSGYYKLMDRLTDLRSMYVISEIRYSQNSLDEDAYNEYAYNNSLFTVFSDALSLFIRDILSSPCAGAMDMLSEGEREYYRNYREMTPEQLEMVKEETDLLDEYNKAANHVEYTFEYNGDEYTQGSAYAAYLAGAVTAEEYELIYNGILENKSLALGEIFTKLLPIRRRTAWGAGYGRYNDYAYANVYGRDYTPDDIIEYREAIKEYIMPLYHDVVRILDASDGSSFDRDFSGDAALDAAEPYIGRMSGELLEAWDYMREYHLYDNDVNYAKSGTGYTISIEGLGAPFIFNNASGTAQDLTTMVHEFGHYNQAYWHPMGPDAPELGYDMAEVHSQGLELLFTHWYPQIFGEGWDYIFLNEMYTMLYVLFQGAIMDEIEYYIYTTADVTAEDINRKFEEISEEYTVPRFSSWDWTDIPHNFTTPCYYISYSVSAAGALAIWLESLDGDYMEAVDSYLRFTALPSDTPFQQAFTDSGYENPISPEYIEELAGAMRKALDVDRRIDVLDGRRAFEDVSEGDWYYSSVYEAYESGLMSGVGGGLFDPYGDASRAMAVKTLWNLGGNGQESAAVTFADVSGQWYAGAVGWAADRGIVRGSYGRFNGQDSVTREQMAVMIYNFLASLGLDMTVDDEISGFTDAADISSWAEEEMAWCVQEGIFEGSFGLLFPGRNITRAELASVIVKTAKLAGSAEN